MEQPNVKIGPTPSNVRKVCPDCGAIGIREMKVEDFDSPAHRAMAAEAIEQGAVLYSCGACGKRWAVLKVSAEQARALAGVPDGSLDNLPAEAPPMGPTPSRRQRRAVTAHNERLLAKNKRLAGIAPEPPVRLVAPEPGELRKMRNAKKKARQLGGR